MEIFRFPLFEDAIGVRASARSVGFVKLRVSFDRTEVTLSLSAAKSGILRYGVQRNGYADVNFSGNSLTFSLKPVNGNKSDLAVKDGFAACVYASPSAAADGSAELVRFASTDNAYGADFPRTITPAPQRDNVSSSPQKETASVHTAITAASANHAARCDLTADELTDSVLDEESLSLCENFFTNQAVSDTVTAYRNELIETYSETPQSTTADATDAERVREPTSADKTALEAVRTLFDRFKPDEALNAATGGRFVTIPFSGGHTYSVGIANVDGTEKICYCIPHVKEDTPPKYLDKFTLFVERRDNPKPLGWYVATEPPSK